MGFEEYEVELSIMFQNRMPINQFAGHRYPVKRVKYSPHDGQILASASYDMSVIIWDSTNLTG